MADKLPEHFAIDFGNHTCKAVWLKNIEKSPKLNAYSSRTTPFGVVNSDSEEHKVQLVDTVKRLVDEAGIKIKEVAIAIPEFSMFTRFLTFPKQISADELQKAIVWEAKQYLTVPIEDVKLGWYEIDSSLLMKDKRKVLLAAAPKKLIDLYVEILERAKLVPVAIESESLATARAISHNYDTAEGVILDFGSQSTDMGIVMGGELVFSQSISTGADALTKAIAADFQLEYSQAEEYKRTYGMDPNQLEGKLFNSMKPVLDLIVGEISRGVEFFKSQTGTSTPGKVYLAGDGALLKGLDKFVASELGVESQLVNSWNNIEIPKKFSEELSDTEPAYTVSVGLALKAE